MSDLDRILRRGYSIRDDDSFSATEQAPTAIHHLRKTNDHFILAAPWRRHTEQREAWKPCL